MKKMKRREFLVKSAVFTGAYFLGGGVAFAGKAETRIEVPAAAPQGSEISIRVTVTHNANSVLHYTEWLWVQVNGKEVARFDYSSGSRPEGETFTKEIKHKVEGPLEIKAKASCNLHGSAGEAAAKVRV